MTVPNVSQRYKSPTISQGQHIICALHNTWSLGAQLQYSRNVIQFLFASLLSFRNASRKTIDSYFQALRWNSRFPNWIYRFVTKCRNVGRVFKLSKYYLVDSSEDPTSIEQATHQLIVVGFSCA